ncbi:heme degradation protein [Billgrantia tianxiuensis]|uniref:Heme degradation protein n=1 Tax=Billgrantia tianxiuensis TaxID=2497861 RepID=A0A6I6SJQ1_9GAMM|nr:MULTISPECIES: ChuX/HutX family heme-like substrate-binding protein [Halomonas]MCE8034285.1 heme degradation protein [Halomonas sp. MCCC 1A11057]QHC50908.1 heme degradation protein [Halomonas tianxiuensis]
MNATTQTRQAILEALDAAREATPHLPALDIARRLEISEGELQAARLGRDVVTLPLSPHALASRFHRLGEVKALTRSRHAVLEQHGQYPILRGSEQAGLLLAPGGLDLRLHLAQWHWACLIRDRRPRAGDDSPERLSLQVFNRHGIALHKAFSLAEEATPAWQELEALGITDAPAFTQSVEPPPRALPTVPTLAEEWAQMSDVHQFFGLLNRHQLRRHEANALMEGRFTRALRPEACGRALFNAAANHLPLMLFVASPGCVQIRTGRIPAPQRMRGWLNLFAKDFTLHLDDANIACVWQVHKPNRDGGVTSLEAFDAQGGLVLQIFSERREGQPERSEWRQLLDELDAREAAA